MLVLALDLANKCGWAMGEPGSIPKVGTLRVENRIKGATFEHPEERPYKLGWLLRDLFKEHGVPNILATEATVDPAFQPSSSTVRSQERYHGAAEAIAGAWHIQQIVDVAPSTIRKHFIGKARLGSSELTKAAVFNRARLLGYPVTTLDESDAVALYDYVIHVTLRTPPREFRLFST